MKSIMSNVSEKFVHYDEELSARPLRETDRGLLDDLFARFPVRFLTPRLNIERYGLDGPVIRAWGATRNSGDSPLYGLMFRLNNTIIAVDANGSCAAAFCRVLDTEIGVAGVRGSIELVEGIRDLVRFYQPGDLERSTCMWLRQPPFIDDVPIEAARRATMGDIDLLSAMYREAGPMYRSRANVAEKLADSRVFVVEEPELGRRAARICSCALLAPEGGDAGLVAGVYTLHAARNRGYAAAVVGALSLDLQKDHKLPVLFYENPIAGRVYSRLGYEPCDDWGVLYLTRRISR